MRSHRFAVFAAGLTVLFPLAACADRATTETRPYDVTGTVTTASVDSDGGRITVVAGPSVRVTETLRYTGTRPDPTHTLDGTALTFTAGCPGHRGNCGVDYRIELPAGTTMTLDSGGGRITVEGMAGDVDLSSNGGAVAASALSSPTFTARTGGGASDLEFTATPAAVRVDSAGGDVTIRVPGERYAVDVRADGGETTILVSQDADAAHRIAVDSQGGDVRVSA